jgi:hypothetical protein
MLFTSISWFLNIYFGRFMNILRRYPGETMKIIADLAAGLGNEHRNRRERNAQKFTMDASNAAEQKISRNNLYIMI